MQKLTEMKHYLEKDETELLILIKSIPYKLSQMTDRAFGVLKLILDFDV